MACPQAPPISLFEGHHVVSPVMALQETEHAQLLTWLYSTTGAVTAMDVAAGLRVSRDEGDRLLRGLLASRPATVDHTEDGLLSVTFDRDARWAPERVRSRIRWRRWRRGLLARSGAALNALDLHLRWLIPVVSVLLIGVAGGIDSWHDPASSLMERWIFAIVGGGTYAVIFAALIYGAFAWWGTALVVGALLAIMGAIHHLGLLLLRPLGPASHGELVALINRWAGVTDDVEQSESPQKKRSKKDKGGPNTHASDTHASDTPDSDTSDSDTPEAGMWLQLIDVMRAVRPAKLNDMWQLARAQRGRFTATDVVRVTGWTGAQLDEALVELAATGEGDVEVDEQARIIWVLSDLANEPTQPKPPPIWTQMDAVAAARSVDDKEVSYDLLLSAGMISWPMSVFVYFFPGTELGVEFLAHGVMPQWLFHVWGGLGMVHALGLICALVGIAFIGRLRNRGFSAQAGEASDPGEALQRGALRRSGSPASDRCPHLAS